MPKVTEDYKRYLDATLKNMDSEYEYVRTHFKELAQYIIPQRYNSLDEGRQKRRDKKRNEYILDGHATRAARTLSAGMLFGATNPTHRWLKLSLDTPNVPAQRWVDYVVEMTLKTMGRSNIYNSLGTTYLDMGTFGTSAMLIYDDPETVIRSYTIPAGEYRVMKDSREKISYLGRKFKMTANQLVDRFGISEVSNQTRLEYERTAGNRFAEKTVHHLIEPNNPPTIPAHFAFREVYWEPDGERDQILALNGYYEKPFIAPRWEVVGNNLYGVSPGMDALPDVISLQHLTRKRAVGLDKMVDPPMVADQSLRNQPKGLMPGGITYVPSASSIGAKPAYQINIPFADLREDKFGYYDSINGHFYTDLFRAILDLRTVRSATEIQEAAAEKLVLLGPTTNRVEDEALSDTVRRVMGILSRRRMYPPPPTGFAGGINIEYDSILSAAQKAAGIQNIERFLGTVGQISPVAPETLHVIEFNETLREYADRLNVPARILRSRDEVAQRTQQQAEAAEQQRQAQIGVQLAQAAGALSDQ